MKEILLGASLLIFASCGTSKNEEVKVDDALEYAKTITAAELKTHLYIYASDAFAGRDTGEPGQKLAIDYLKKYYIAEGISSPISEDDYFQEVPAEFLNKRERKVPLKDSENVLAFIEGSEKPKEIVVISAHLDHIGVKDGEIYNGADDDGSGTVAILEIAQAFKEAAQAGKGPKRSVLFLHVTGEEKGLLGSEYYTENPVFSLENTVCNLNIDMVGRIDDLHKADTSYVYLVGSDKLSLGLHNLSKEINNKYTNLSLDYKYNDDKDPLRIYYRSDHYNFAKHNVPIIFYFSGLHADYHKPTDTAEKINYELLEARTRLIFHTAWEVANRNDRITADKIVEKEAVVEKEPKK